jgi:hypothetical protein
VFAVNEPGVVESSTPNAEIRQAFGSVFVTLGVVK